MRQMRHHPHRAAKRTQLLLGTDPGGVQRDQPNAGRAMSPGTQAGQLGGRGGFAYAGSTHQGKHAALFKQGFAACIGAQVALKDRHHPAHRLCCPHALGHALQNSARQQR